ncbi:hypothetical protein SAMN05192580_0157 [Sphingomonas jatrophae]|uniref:Uncharacterized protein n=1 Tax=Sphingomonas jatrophae TaxID=1166337 RepID=A0A1I6JDX6_9SPHN|nr:hypothetical protein SAMN05192580_0157 [Sphingomonas jatrophae]
MSTLEQAAGLRLDPVRLTAGLLINAVGAVALVSALVG